MENINRYKVHLVSTQNLSKIEEDEWDIISKQKYSYILDDKCEDLSLLRFPGFVFSNKQAKTFYDSIYNDFIRNNIYTPSRGNLSKGNNYIFMGIRPGHVYAHLSKADTAWLFGPSSIMLHKFLLDKKIYPYFTNIYNEPTKKFNNDFKFITKELAVISFFYKKVYNVNELNIVFMGKYPEYDLFKNSILNNKQFNKIGVKLTFNNIWHPGYLARSYNDNKFEIWKKQLV